MTETQIANGLLYRRMVVGRRRGHHISQAEFAAAVGVSVATYKWAEKHGIARATTRDKVLAFLALTPEQVLTKWFSPRVQGNRKRRVR